MGLNLSSGEPMDPIQEGVYDSFRVLRNCIASSAGIASNLLLCDELLKARQMVRRLLRLKSEQLNGSHSKGSTHWSRCRRCRAISFHLPICGSSKAFHMIRIAVDVHYLIDLLHLQPHFRGSWFLDGPHVGDHLSSSYAKGYAGLSQIDTYTFLHDYHCQTQQGPWNLNYLN